MSDEKQSVPSQPTEEEVRSHLARLDGTPASAVALITNTPVEKLDQYGGMPPEEKE